MRTMLCSALAATMFVSSAASAGPLDLAQPALAMKLDFGGPQTAAWRVGLKLDYGAAVQLVWNQRRAGMADTGRERMTLLASSSTALPAIAQWDFSSTGEHRVLMNGLLLGSGPLMLHEDGSRPAAERHSFWGFNVGTIVIAAGGALALIVATAGHAAKEQQRDGGISTPAASAGSTSSSGSSCNGVEAGGHCIGDGGGG